MEKTVTVEIPIEVLYQIGIALDNDDCDEQQRDTWGDATVDWINAVSDTHQADLNQHYQDLLKASKPRS